MANKAISELPQALNVNNQDLFVLEQSGIAKKLTAETFITEQGIIDALAEALDGHGGISSVTLSSVSGRIRTYLITFTDETTTTFQVLDGTSIDRIVKTSTAGLVDTYTVFMNDGTTTFFTVTNGADGTVSEAMLNDALKDKAPAITETTESSAIANFADGADDLVMHNIVAEIAPVQSGSGDPSPSNIRPISGWTGCNVARTGKNLWNKDRADAQNGYYFISGEFHADNDYRCLSFPCSPGDKFIKSGSGWGGIVTFWNNDSFVSGVNNTSVTIPSGANIVKFACQYSSTDAQLEVGSTATAYEPYIAPATVSLSWQDEAGTVYGGTIDVATGLLTVTHELFDMGNAASFTGDSNRPGIYRFSIPGRKSASYVTACSAYKIYNNISTSEDYYITGYWAYGGGVVFFRDSSMAGYTSAQVKAAVSGYKLIYELATPQTYQLTGQQLATFLGTNNVWANTGNVSVTYPADTKMFIEKLTQPTEDDMTANQAITSGKFFMVGNNLYIATAAIASGAKIIEGTNATRLSLADALNRL